MRDTTTAKHTLFYTIYEKKNETKNRESFKRVDLAARLKQTSPNHDLLYFSLLARMAVLCCCCWGLYCPASKWNPPRRLFKMLFVCCLLIVSSLGSEFANYSTWTFVSLSLSRSVDVMFFFDEFWFVRHCKEKTHCREYAYIYTTAQRATGISYRV